MPPCGSNASNGVFINVQANMAAGARRIYMGTLFTNRKSPSISSVSVAKNDCLNRKQSLHMR